MRWEVVDFDRKTITINHIISMPRIDGKTIINAEDNAKTKSSLRTLPLAETIEKKLLEHRAKQEEYRSFFKKDYCKDWLDYICSMPNGRLITPNYITLSFCQFLKDNNFRPIRFHDLMHTCATLMQKNDIDINYIKEYLGHSDISTTANTYSHLDLKAMKKPVEKMSSILKLLQKNRSRARSLLQNNKFGENSKNKTCSKYSRKVGSDTNRCEGVYN